MSNSILEKGCVTPFIIMNFAAGSIDQIPPKYFMSFRNVRTCLEGCQFELSIMYAPDAFSPGTPEIINQMLLASVNKDVTWQYGFYASDGQIYMQDSQYCGSFTTYSESIGSDGSLSYTIKGVGSWVSMLTQEITLPEYKATQKTLEVGGGLGSWVSMLTQEASELSGGLRPTDYLEPKIKYGILRKYFSDYDIIIQHLDNYVSEIPASTGSILDVIIGKTNSDNTKQGGLVSLSTINTSRYLKSTGISDRDLYYYNNYHIIGSSYSNASSEVVESAKEAYERISDTVDNLLTCGFIAYFDTSTNNSSKKGTFYYGPRTLGTSAEQYTYEFGNNIKNSDVLDFSVDYNGAVAMASMPSTKVVDNSIDAAGNNIGSSNVITSSSNFNRNTYTTLSGFNEEVFMSRSLLSDKLVYPFKASMKIVGQLKISHLLDEIDVTVLVNGTEHPAFSGKYTILGITDELGADGFTTSLELQRISTPEQSAAYDTWVANNSSSNAQKVQDNIDNGSTTSNSDSNGGS